MAKKKIEASPGAISGMKVEKVFMPEVKTESEEKPKAQKEQSPTPIENDMTAIRDELVARLAEEDVKVNSHALPTVIIGDDYVQDLSAMIPPNIGPSFAPHNFMARVTCVVEKGQNTGLRLELLKKAVRASLQQKCEESR